MLNKIRNTCHYVADNSKYVKINYTKLDEFIKHIEYENLKHWLLYNPYDLLELDVKTIINFLLIFESIDYSFWGQPKWEIQTEKDIKDGSDALLYIMLKYVKETQSTDFSNLSLKEFKKLLKGNVEIPLIEKRYETIVSVSRTVNEKMKGNFYKFVKDINLDTKLFDVIISNFKEFIDERIYNNKKIYFYKLAQLLTSDILHIREKIENISVDYSNLIGCADYKIPQTLRAVCVLEYNNELSKIVDKRVPIEVSSEYEVEIRASQIVVIDYISKKMNVNAIDINDFLFVYSKRIKDITKPYHLCRNTNY